MASKNERLTTRFTPEQHAFLQKILPTKSAALHQLLAQHVPEWPIGARKSGAPMGNRNRDPRAKMSNDELAANVEEYYRAYVDAGGDPSHGADVRYFEEELGRRGVEYTPKLL